MSSLLRLGVLGVGINVTYSGSYAVFGTKNQGRIELYSSGTLTFLKSMTVDIFAVGTGAAGQSAYAQNTYNDFGGHGGPSGQTETVKGVVVNGSYSAVIPNSVGYGVRNNPTTLGSLISASAGYASNFDNQEGGDAGALGANYDRSSEVLVRNAAYGDGVYGELQGHNMYSFGETNNTIYGGGGSGGGVRWNSGNWASGVYGYIGGGYGGLYSSGFYAGGNGHINTGGGGGGGAYEYNYPADTGHPGGLGGTGIIIVRWGY